MQSLAAVFLGTFSVMVAMPVGCSGPEWGTPSGGPSSASGSGGAAGGGGSGRGFVLKGPQECTDFCLRYQGVCGTPIGVQSCIDQYCDQSFKHAGPACQDEFKAHYPCLAAWAASVPPDMLCDPTMHSGCTDGSALYDCAVQYGCVLTGPCNPGWSAPNGGKACHCGAECLNQYVSSLCSRKERSRSASAALPRFS